MKKISSFNFAKVLLLALLAAGLNAGRASAQEYNGTFTLPFEARWGLATLPPGNYSFRLDTAVSPYTVTICGEKRSHLVMSSYTENNQASGRSELVVVRSAGNARIRALHLVDRNSGWTFVYPVPKAERNYLAHAPQLIQRLPILMASK